MNEYLTRKIESIHSELETIDIENSNISIEESTAMIDYIDDCLSEIKSCFISQKSIPVENEIRFFKEYKPKILGLLLFFNKTHAIELKRPTGSNETLREYYETELKNLTYFFDRNLDFYQYYRSGATYMDEYYFQRIKKPHKLCMDSIYYVIDTDFSPGYDYKVAKINCNEMLRIYLIKKMNGIEKQMTINKNRAVLPFNNLKWTGSKVAAVELGYALESSRFINRGNADIKEIMLLIETCFNIDLGEYYRTYISIKQRKKDRTPFLQSLIDSMTKRMDDDDSK
ncbi:RteC domain-containing protein [Dysgonomonas sp. 520]|uniref:RteC domain-containing protein n=1 Tax=Dysgonomonas sp. 520 TaxID=2302931 RepID=UPI0013D72557|nr:RteC domain-containing protein [Dysgonomonas sp. 520]NDW08631.1 hypothetical protein [Dysgonomonas sp. 520]